ncbi:DUF1287 domain-containing protein [Tepidicaulis marinus]|nr:DUF1287 domain-containing protein [Tepidicaulis marinus]
MITRRKVLSGFGTLFSGALTGGALFSMPGCAGSSEAGEARGAALDTVLGEDLPEPARQLIIAAEAQIGLTRRYDPSYVRLDYPGGDVPLERGVCTDVVIRAYRAGLGLDLQELVHEDMRAAFADYPPHWGLKKPDPNIDHRRVPNLAAFFARQGAEVKDGSYRPGDLVTQNVFGRPHIVVVSAKTSPLTGRRRVIHNMGRGTEYGDWLGLFPETGHFRFRTLAA